MTIDLHTHQHQLAGCQWQHIILNLWKCENSKKIVDFSNLKLKTTVEQFAYFLAYDPNKLIKTTELYRSKCRAVEQILSGRSTIDGERSETIAKKTD